MSGHFYFHAFCNSMAMPEGLTNTWNGHRNTQCFLWNKRFAMSESEKRRHHCFTYGFSASSHTQLTRNQHFVTTHTQCTFWGQGKTHKLLICLQYKAALVSDNLEDDVALHTLQSEKERCRLGLRGGAFSPKQHVTNHFLNQNKKVLCLN